MSGRTPFAYACALAAVLATVSLAACFGSPKDTHPDKVLTQRKALFKKMLRTLEPMELVANGRKDYDRNALLLSAQELDTLSAQPWALFTADGNYPPTRAKPELWQKPAEFRQAQDKYQATVTQLVNTAQGGDLEKIKTAVSGVTQSCKSCHDQFRND